MFNLFKKKKEKAYIQAPLLRYEFELKDKKAYYIFANEYYHYNWVIAIWVAKDNEFKAILKNNTTYNLKNVKFIVDLDTKWKIINKGE